jgi:pimeloyl-ACP methyl ester carboxylesterase
MSDPAHTFGRTCVFRDDEAVHAPTNFSDPPPIKAQFFYVSSLPIDDPLSPLPPISSDTKPSQAHQPQPFSIRDDAALSDAWQSIKNIFASASASGKKSRDPLRPQIGERGRTLGELVRFPRFKGDGKSPTAGRDATEHASVKSLELPASTGAGLFTNQKMKKPQAREGEASQDEASERSSQKKHRHFSPLRKFKNHEEGQSSSGVPSPIAQADGEADTDISGRPFARAPTLGSIDGQNDHDSLQTATQPEPREGDTTNPPYSPPTHSKFHNVFHPHKEGHEEEDEKVVIPVGISRLHLVELPDLLMKPIYWSPVNDISAVIRGTWFYATTMLPVEPDLANWLETGYQELRPWTETWQDELNSCVENGAEAEMKVVYHLFPERKSSRPGTGAETKADDTEASTSRQLLAEGQTVQHENFAAGPQLDSFRAWAPDSSQRYKNHRVIYTNARQAQILRPSVAPSFSRNRRPLAAVRKGREIGVPVVRGFNRRAWEKLNPPNKMNVRAAHAKVGAYMSQSSNADTPYQDISCPACKVEEQKRAPHVTDLVLVIHGIGQKLSEKVDSFHFTHAINSFRREVNVQLSSGVVHGTTRKEQGGIMVLPVNWRLTVSFDDGVEAKNVSEQNKFQLEDITPDTLPAIRSLISDVMLDIPYYLSHHKQKMISAVVREANRVYRLWCRNNPDFHENGRVHIIAHSLGSAMAMDILSQQPTKPPELIELSPNTINETMFEFDTKSLFLCGSPAGFFLLLNKAALIPRTGRQKPGADGEDERGISGESGRYGCLAVDNIYNVMAPYDPISYRMNAAVDSEYAASLKAATIPSMRQGFLASIGLKWGASDSTRPFGLTSSTASASAQRPSMNKMPSTIEMDTHNFTREEVAEKRMFLLNDNGQIDFTLSTDGGPLDFQYWNMLSAHSSYWLRQDFVRFLVVEIGREQGREGTLTALMAQKKRVFKAGKIA